MKKTIIRRNFLLLLFEKKAFFVWLLISLTPTILLGFYRLIEVKHNSFVASQQFISLPLCYWEIITYAGDGLIAASIVVVLVIVKNLRLAALIMSVWVIGACAVQTLKHTIYKDRLRPVEWFKKHEMQLDIPDGHEPYRTHSFPSGHTATAFGIWGMLSYHNKRPFAGFVFALITVFAAWSRIALFQHFPADVVAGGLIGTCSIFAAIWLSRKLESKFPRLLANQ